jgi:hypothetical protein
MRRSNVAVWALVLLVGLLGSSSVLLRPVRAQTTVENKTPPTDRPGDAMYAPTKLEWAALELQANYGQTNWTSETPVMINFLPLDDGKTVLCLLQFTPDVPAVTVKIDRDSEQTVFESYAHSRGWSWLRLQFREKILPRPSPIDFTPR